jgi:hypothetical protein
VNGRLVVRLKHVIRAEHASTGRVVSPIRATFDGPAPPGWHLRARGSEIVVTARDGVPAPAALPDVRLTLADPALAIRVDQPVATVALTDAEIVHRYQPVPMTLTVELASSTGGPVTGKTVQARGMGAAAVALPELGDEAGTYRSAARVWPASFHPLDVLVDGTPVRKLSIDFTSKDTRVRVLDTT